MKKVGIIFVILLLSFTSYADSKGVVEVPEKSAKESNGFDKKLKKEFDKYVKLKNIGDINIFFPINSRLVLLGNGNNFYLVDIISKHIRSLNITDIIVEKVEIKDNETIVLSETTGIEARHTITSYEIGIKKFKVRNKIESARIFSKMSPDGKYTLFSNRIDGNLKIQNNLTKKIESIKEIKRTYDVFWFKDSNRFIYFEDTGEDTGYVGNVYNINIYNIKSKTFTRLPHKTGMGISYELFEEDKMLIEYVPNEDNEDGFISINKLNTNKSAEIMNVLPLMYIVNKKNKEILVIEQEKFGIYDFEGNIKKKVEFPSKFDLDLKNENRPYYLKILKNQNNIIICLKETNRELVGDSYYKNGNLGKLIIANNELREYRALTKDWFNISDFKILNDEYVFLLIENQNDVYLTRKRIFDIEIIKKAAKDKKLLIRRAE